MLFRSGFSTYAATRDAAAAWREDTPAPALPASAAGTPVAAAA